MKHFRKGSDFRRTFVRLYCSCGFAVITTREQQDVREAADVALDEHYAYIVSIGGELRYPKSSGES